MHDETVDAAPGPVATSVVRFKPAGGTVLIYTPSANRPPREHERATHAAVARQLAALRGYAFGGSFEAASHRPIGSLYLLPADTLESLDAASALGVYSEGDLFGGVVPCAFVATKTITHSLVASSAAAPSGWTPGFAERVRPEVLPGYSAFALDDALRAGERLLGQGSVRLKRASGIGGSGQSVVNDMKQLARELKDLDAEGWREGLVLETNLSEVHTRSVGQVLVGDMVASYVGTQRLTRNNRGEAAYGGSRLTVVRGGFDRLLTLPLTPRARTAVVQAAAYHCAALDCFPGMFASRANYDVAQGIDDTGQWRSGVLEQSWRVGGATGAEVQALQAFKHDPSLQIVQASTTECYGDGVQVPLGAVLYFAGHDAHVGPLTKYSQLVSTREDACRVDP